MQRDGLQGCGVVVKQEPASLTLVLPSLVIRLATPEEDSVTTRWWAWTRKSGALEVMVELAMGWIIPFEGSVWLSAR